MRVTSEATADDQAETGLQATGRPLPGNTTSDQRAILLVIVASLVATIPVWLASFPPMVDLPEHAAQVALLRNLQNPGFSYADLFRVNWFTPYLFGYILMYALTPLFGIVGAAKFAVAIAVAGLPISTGLLMRETGADCYWALLTIPAMYGFSYGWGFLNFLVAVPVGLLFLVAAIRYTRRPTVRGAAFLALFSILLFFSHALTYLFFAAIAGLYALLETRNLQKTAVAVCPVAATLPLALVWFLRTKADPNAQSPVVWDLGWITPADPHTWGGRLTGLFPRLLGLWSPLFCLIFGIALFVLPLLAGARLSRRLSVWAPLAVCLLVIFCGPTGGHSGWALSQRFVVFALSFFVLGLEKSPASRPAWRGAAIFLLLAWMVIATSLTLRYDAEAKGFNRIMSAMEPNQRVLSLMFVQHTKQFPAPVFVHFPAWYSATKQGVVDMNFAVFPVALVRYKPMLPSPDSTVSEWHPETFRWDQWRGDLYRYFIVHAPVDLGYKLFGSAPCAVSLVTRSGNWWLYERDPHCESASEPREPQGR